MSIHSLSGWMTCGTLVHSTLSLPDDDIYVLCKSYNERAPLDLIFSGPYQQSIRWIWYTLVFTKSSFTQYCFFTHQRLKSIQTMTEGVKNITISADCDATCKGPVLDPGGASSQVGGQPGVSWGSRREGHTRWQHLIHSCSNTTVVVTAHTTQMGEVKLFRDGCVPLGNKDFTCMDFLL